MTDIKINWQYSDLCTKKKDVWSEVLHRAKIVAAEFGKSKNGNPMLKCRLFHLLKLVENQIEQG
ncbi:MAG: hypothetical protein LBB06_00640 [Endomicrobium sp.]|nr:hypothetical protein [Endomicrobium sp.]